MRTSREDLDTSASSKKSAISAAPYGTLGVNRDQWGPGVENTDRERFDSVLEKVLAELEPVALQEQMFCINFFQMDVISPTSKNTQTTLEVLEKSTDSASILASPTAASGGGDASGKFTDLF